MVWCKQSCRRRIGTFANGQLRFLKNLGDPFVSSTKSRLEIPGYQLQALAAHSSVRERTQRVNVEVPPSEGNEVRRSWASGSRSTCIVLMKPGNWSRRTRWREGQTERGCLMLDPGSGNTSEALNLELRINDTAQDSELRSMGAQDVHA